MVVTSLGDIFGVQVDNPNGSFKAKVEIAFLEPQFVESFSYAGLVSLVHRSESTVTYIALTWYFTPRCRFERDHIDSWKRTWSMEWREKASSNALRVLQPYYAPSFSVCRRSTVAMLVRLPMFTLNASFAKDIVMTSSWHHAYMIITCYSLYAISFSHANLLSHASAYMVTEPLSHAFRIHMLFFLPFILLVLYV